MQAMIVGLGVAIAVAAFAKITRFDRDRSFYPTVLIVIAAYYVLFAFMAADAVVEELTIAAFFVILAVAGARVWPLLAGMGIMLHGVFDWLHPMLFVNAGVPEWWPSFCAAVDLLLGAWVIWSTRKNTQRLHCLDKGTTSR